MLMYQAEWNWQGLGLVSLSHSVLQSKIYTDLLTYDGFAISNLPQATPDICERLTVDVQQACEARQGPQCRPVGGRIHRRQQLDLWQQDASFPTRCWMLTVAAMHAIENVTHVSLK